MRSSLLFAISAISAALLAAADPHAAILPYARRSALSRSTSTALSRSSSSLGSLFNLIRRGDDDALFARDGHDHGHGHGHGFQPMLELDEEDIVNVHGPSPPSYGTHDFDDPDVQQKYPGLMLLHVLFMSLAFFGALPAGIALRSVNHAWHGFSVILFYTFIIMGISSSALYTKLTGSMYEGQRHSLYGYIFIFVAMGLTFLDLLALLRRGVSYVRNVRSGEQSFSVKGLWRSVILAQKDHDGSEGYEMLDTANTHGEFAHLVADPDHESNEDVDDEHGERISLNSNHEDMQQANTARWADTIRAHRQRDSMWRASVASDNTLFHAQNSSAAPTKDTLYPGQRSPRQNSQGSTSDDTLHDPHHIGLPLSQEDQLKQHHYPSNGGASQSKISLVKRIGSVAFATAERTLVICGYMQVLTGIAVYTGACRGTYINVCAAHLIKGGIFWCYGLFSFARFLGAYSELGWAWNRPKPSATEKKSDPMSAEFIECILIFIYGSTNVWMERFDAKPGDPFTTKQIQHISIAIMFFFAGALGMCLESRRFRRWLSGSTEVSRYTPSFNPFPAVVVGVTGAAMAAHTQDYVFEKEIHIMWGNLLVAAAVLRCVTYFFLWVAPKRADPHVPSRPPTEALASFFLACGGLMFQASTEELMFAAMRRGHDDQMMFLNVAVAITSLALCWTLGVVAFNAWLKFRSQKSSGSISLGNAS